MKRSVCVYVAAAIVWSAGVLTHAAMPSDIVLYASDVTVVRGNWSKAASSSSPGGVMLASAGGGWSSTNAPAPTEPTSASCRSDLRLMHGLSGSAPLGPFAICP